MTDEDDSVDPNPDELRGNRQARWTKHFDEIDREIAQLASICKVSILDPA